MIGQGLALVEFFHNAPSVDGVLRCLAKHIERGWKLRNAESSRMWIVTAGHPSTALAKLGFVRDEDWPIGTYRLPHGFSTQLMVVSELPVRRDTLMLRVLGAGEVLRAALAEVAALPDDAPERSVVLPVVVNLLKANRNETSDDEEEFRMATNEFVQEWERKIREEGRDAGREEGRDAGREEGRDAGRKEGREEGSANAKRESLTVILRARFGELEAHTVARVAAARTDELGQWIERAITAASVSGVFEPPR